MIRNKKSFLKEIVKKIVKNSEKYHVKKKKQIYKYWREKERKKIDLTTQNTNINRNVTKGVEKYDVFPRSNKMQGKAKKKKKLRNKKYTSKRKYRKIL